MNSEQIFSLLRIVVGWFLASLVARGYLKPEDVTSLTQMTMTACAALGALGLAGYGVYKRRSEGLIASAAAQPSVRQIVADPTTAASVPSDKVVPPAAGAGASSRTAAMVQQEIAQSAPGSLA